MGFLDRLRGTRPAPVVKAMALHLEGDELIAAVGESHYQPALHAASGARLGEVVAFDCLAVLVPEPDNPYDANAVMVQVDANLVAYLSREDAASYRSAVQSAATSQRVIACNARIAGRGGNSDTLNLGIFLHLPSPDTAEADVRAVSK
jgi:hypothetical protein